MAQKSPLPSRSTGFFIAYLSVNLLRKTVDRGDVMAIRALSIDFWNTMVVAHTNGHRRQQERLGYLLGVVQKHRPQATDTAILAAYEEAAHYFDATWTQRHRTPTTSDMVHRIWDVLDLHVDATQHDGVVRVFEEGILAGPPNLADGFEEALAWAAERYRLGIISDTMFSPGHVIRRLLDQLGVLQYFDVFVFSDETGFSKPDTRAFLQAGTALGIASSDMIHIGDLRRTDVAGAQQAGLRSILFTGIHEDLDEAPVPDAILPHWQALPDVIGKLSR